MRLVTVLGPALLLAACARTQEPRPEAERRAAGFQCVAPRGDVRSCVYADAHGRVRIDDSVGTIRRLYVDDRGQWRELPRFYGNTLWSECELPLDSSYTPRSDRVAVADVDGDGRDDVVVVADCITGVGPTGAQPFAVGTIYVQESPGRYSASDARDSTFTEALPDACNTGPCDVLPAARAAVRGGRPP